MAKPDKVGGEFLNGFTRVGADEQSGKPGKIGKSHQNRF